MKKIEKITAVFFISCMLIVSGVLLYTSVFASVPSTQSTAAVVAFDGLSGIRYNPSTKSFEVFSAAGVSWINSSRSISIDGVISPSGNHPNGAEWAKAEGAVTYNIMRDIAYLSSDEITALGESFNAAFLTAKPTIPVGAVLNGRGFYLKGFPVSGRVASALVSVNNGSIRNMVVAEADISESQGDSLGIICATNYGEIYNCAVYGAGAGNSYKSSNFLAMYGIAAENIGIIRNCTNNANITNEASNAFAAGIAGGKVNSEFVNNINNGNILTPNSGSDASGIAIVDNNYQISFRGNTNNNRISGESSASGIVGGRVGLSKILEWGNVNNGVLSASNVFDMYRTVSADYLVVPDSGIRLNSGVFEVYTTKGFSYISSGVYVSTTGTISQDLPGNGEFEQANSDAQYVIMKDIVYDSNAEFDNGFSTSLAMIGSNGSVDGRNYNLVDFPIRKHSGKLTLATSGTQYNAYAALFGKNEGVISGINVIINNSLAELETNTIIGGIAAINAGTGKINDCSFSGSLEGIGAGSVMNQEVVVLGSQIFVGGIVGLGSGTISNCSKTGLIRANSYAGGIVGMFQDGQVDNCSSAGEIWTYDWPGGGGGVIGGVSGTNVNVDSCINYSVVRRRVGVHSGAVDRFQAHGGIIGRLEGLSTSTLKITGCTNYASFLDDYGGTMRGGILGATNNISLIKLIDVLDCVNYGDLYARQWASSAGGILGFVMYYNNTVSEYIVRVANSINYGNIYGRERAGGIIGYCRTRVHVESAINHGNITADVGDAGGIIGSHEQGGVVGYISYNLVANFGDIKSMNGNAGGHLGRTTSKIVAQINVNHGSVQASGSGFAGAFVGSATLKWNEETSSVDDTNGVVSYLWHSFTLNNNIGVVSGLSGPGAPLIGNLYAIGADLPSGGNSSILPS